MLTCPLMLGRIDITQRSGPFADLFGGFLPSDSVPLQQRQYEHIKESAEKSGRYGKRAKEVAARTVMKEHKEKGHWAGQ